MPRPRSGRPKRFWIDIETLTTLSRAAGPAGGWPAGPEIRTRFRTRSVLLDRAAALALAGVLALAAVVAGLAAALALAGVLAGAVVLLLRRRGRRLGRRIRRSGLGSVAAAGTAGRGGLSLRASDAAREDSRDGHRQKRSVITPTELHGSSPTELDARDPKATPRAPLLRRPACRGERGDRIEGEASKTRWRQPALRGAAGWKIYRSSSFRGASTSRLVTSAS